VTGRTDAAIRSLRRVVALGDSAFAEEAHFHLAKAFLAKADPRSAARELEEAIALQGERNEEARRLLEAVRRAAR
jgi:hypothetical protein